MSAHITRSRVVAAGAAVLALAVVTGCGSTKESPAAAPTTGSPSVSQTPTGSAAPPGTAAPAVTTTPANAPAGSATLTQAGTNLKFGQVANVEAGSGSDKWIAGLKVTALEKAPRSDYKEMGMRDDAGIVYYMRYDVTRLTGTMKSPPDANEASKAKPLFAEGQKVSRAVLIGYSKCATSGGKRTLEIGETATNKCETYVVDKGTLTQVTHSFFDSDKNERSTITWK